MPRLACSKTFGDPNVNNISSLIEGLVNTLIMDHHAQLADFVDVLAVDFDIVDTTGRRLEENPNPKGNSAESWS